MTRPSPNPPSDPAREMAPLRARLPQGFSVGYGGDGECAAAMLAGAAAFYSVAAAAWPAEMPRLDRAAQAGDPAETQRIDAAFAPNGSLLGRSSSFSSSFRTVYRAADLLGLSGAQPPRPILASASGDEALRQAIAALEADWAYRCMRIALRRHAR